MPAQVLETGKNTYGVEFTPRQPGEHRISVALKGAPVPGSPFACKVYDVSAIKVRDTEKGVVGKPVTFLGEIIKQALRFLCSFLYNILLVAPCCALFYNSCGWHDFVFFAVETSQAGPGNLEVTVNGGQVPTSAQAQGSHTYAISFTPKEAKPHMIELRFNGEDIPG